MPDVRVERSPYNRNAAQSTDIRVVVRVLYSIVQIARLLDRFVYHIAVHLATESPHSSVTAKNATRHQPPSAIHDLSRMKFEERVAALTQIIHDANSRNADRSRAMDLLGKYGLGL